MFGPIELKTTIILCDLKGEVREIKITDLVQVNQKLVKGYLK